jgi:hypothetical protein
MLLSKKQKAEIGQLAQAAWHAQTDVQAELCEANPGLSLPALFTGWRRVEQGKVLGEARQSLTQADQTEYARLMAHFAALTGNEALTEQWRHRAVGDGRARAEWHLYEALKRADLKLEYAAVICRAQNRCELREASERQLWRLVYTLRARVRAKRVSQTT